MNRVSDAVSSMHNQDGGIVLDSRQGQIFKLNCVGSRILELLKSGGPESSIASLISEEFGVERGIVERDLQEFMDELSRRGILREPR
jgi:hypothetical protein